MEELVPLDRFPDPHLRERVKKKLEDLKAFEREIPAVFIVHDIRDTSVLYMSQRGLDSLGITFADVWALSSEEYHGRFFNPEDAEFYVPKILGLVERNNPDELISFFQQVRPSADHDWIWYHSSTKIFLRDLEEKPVLLLTLAVPIDAKSHITTKVERLMWENNFLRKNKDVFTALTKREKEVLRLMALGHNYSEIARQLYMSEKTALTHRRNIKSKLKAKSNYDIHRFAQAFDLI
jgi:DNA-binding CsgD family transcriptional regulator